MTTPTAKQFTPVSLSSDQAAKLETLMEEQLQDAIIAHSVQVAKVHQFNSNWRFVASIGQLKTFKLRGSDPLSSTSSWATTLEKTTRATACTLNDFSCADECWSSRRRAQIPQTIADPCSSRGPLDPLSPIQSSRTFGSVHGNYRDIIAVHHAVNSADFVQQQKLLSPMVIDGAVLRTIRATKETYLGIKWLTENSFSGKRDNCFVEMVGFTTHNGQEIGFVAFASIDVPECPELGCLKLKRLRMKRTMLVIPAKDAPDTTSEIFVMGASEAPYITNTRYRFNMAVLNDISLVIDSHNITRQPLVLHKDWVPNNTRPLCSICSRKFQFVSRRRHHCRMCGDIVCKTCYVKRSVRREEIGKSQSRDALAICQTKFCLRCITNLRAIDKRFDNFSPQVSKMLSISVDTLNISTTEEFIDLDSPDSYPRSSSFFTFYNGTHSQRNSKRTSVEFPWNTTADRIDPREKITGGGVGTLASRSSGKKRSSSLSINLAHSSSYPRLRGLSRLSRRSSIASIYSQSELYEENMVFGYDEKTHTPPANEAGDQWFALIR